MSPEALEEEYIKTLRLIIGIARSAVLNTSYKDSLIKINLLIEKALAHES
jgi:hypothetical protein